MTNRYKVEMTLTGETINEIASKVMVAAYTGEFDIEDLLIEQVSSDPQWLTEEEDVDTFQFPHVKSLIDGLNERNRNGKA